MITFNEQYTGEIIHGEDLFCPVCGIDGYPIGIQYAYDHPEHYDGVSEWMCIKCNYREGRWSGRELKDGEIEPRYGGD